MAKANDTSDGMVKVSFEITAEAYAKLLPKAQALGLPVKFYLAQKTITEAAAE
jgi:hypothetical protein